MQRMVSKKVDSEQTDCFLCHEVLGDQECYGHLLGGHHYRRLYKNRLSGPVTPLHTAHLKCLKQYIECVETGRLPNQCLVCATTLDIEKKSRLGKVYCSPEIQNNESLRRKWITFFPDLQTEPERRVTKFKAQCLKIHRTIPSLLGFFPIFIACAQLFIYYQMFANNPLVQARLLRMQNAGPTWVVAPDGERLYYCPLNMVFEECVKILNAQNK